MESLVNLIVGIAWPLLIGFIILRFEGEFRQLFLEVRDIIGRTRRIGKGGMEIEPRPQTPPPGSPTSNPLTSEPEASQATPTGGVVAKSIHEVPQVKRPAREFIGQEYRAYFDSEMKRIAEHLPTVFERASDLKDDVYKSIIAEFTGAIRLERATRAIFMSQIEALEALKGHAESLTKEMFRPYYEKARQLYPQVYLDYSFDQWFQFLVAMELVNEQSGKVTITEAGKVTNLYMLQQRYRPSPW